MSVFDWLFRRNRRTEGEPLSPPPPPAAPPTYPVASEPPPVADAPGSVKSPEPGASATGVSTDPYGTEFLPVTRAEIVEAAKKGNLLSTAFQFGRQSII